MLSQKRRQCFVHYRAFWQRKCRAAAAGVVLKPSGGNYAVLPYKKLQHFSPSACIQGREIKTPVKIYWISNAKPYTITEEFYMNKIAIAAMSLTAAFAFSLAACAEMHYAQPISEPAASQSGCRYSLRHI